MQLTWQGFVVLGIIVYFVVSGAWHGRAERVEMAVLSALDPCGVATAYSEWRVTFETALGDVDTVEGATLRTFRSRSGTFEQATKSIRRELVGQVSDAERGLLDALIAMTGNDATRSSTQRSPQTFVERWFDACPVQAYAVLAR